MPSTYSPLKIELPATGEQSGTWGNTTNTNLGTALEEAITGSANVTFASANVTLTLTDTNASQTARNLRLNLIGVTGGATRTLTVPAIKKLYLVSNNCADSVIVGNSTGATVTVPAGNNIFVYNDGTDVLNAITYITNLNAVAVSAGTVTTTQVDIVSQGDLRLQDTTGGQFVALQAPGTIATSYTLTLPVDDGTNGQALITDGNGVLSWSTAASGDVYGPASATDNAIARFDLTTGKIIQNSSALVDDAGNVLAGAGLVSAPAFSTTGDTNTGIYFPAADTIAFAEGGVEAMRIDSSANVGIGTNSITAIFGTTLQIGNSSTASTLSLTGSGAGTIGDVYLAGTADTAFLYARTSTPLVLGAGDAERIRITATGDVGIGTNSPTALFGLTLQLGNGSSSSTFSLTGSGAGTIGDLYLAATATTASLFARDSTPLIFGANNIEQMRITSAGNVGIGNTSPARKLEITAIPSASSQLNGIRVAMTSTPTSISEFLLGTSAGGIPFTSIRTGNDGNGWMEFYTGSGPTERMRIDSLGNLGLGVVPSAWGTFFSQKALQIGPVTAINSIDAGSGNKQANFLNNAYFDSTNYRYITTDAATLYQQVNGIHIWQRAASGTAGNAITFSESMRIDSSGNVGIGTASPSAYGKFAVLGAAGTPQIIYTDGTVTGAAGYIVGTTAYSGTRTNHNLGFLVNDSERMRIDTFGNIGIGTSSPASFTGGSNGLAVSINGNSGMAILRNAATSGVTFDQLQIGVAQGASANYHFIRCYHSVNTAATPVHFVNGNGDGYFAGDLSIGTGSSIARLSVANLGTANSAAVDLLGQRSFAPTTFGATSIIAVSDGTRNSHDFGAIRFEQNPATSDGGGALVRLFAGGASSSFAANCEFLRGEALGNTDGVNNIQFRTQGTERVRIDLAGNVGIGTNSPLQRLDVASTATGVFQTIRSTSSGATNIALRIQDGTTGTSNTDGIYLGRTGAENFLWTYENEPWIFATNNAERMRISNTGNVGISNSSPIHKLSIGNPATSASTTTPETIGLGGTFSSAPGANAKLRIWEDTSVSQYMGIGVSSNQLDYIATSSYAHVWYSGGSERMRIRTDGNVGINAGLSVGSLAGGLRAVSLFTNEMVMCPATAAGTNVFFNVCDSTGNNGANYNFVIRGLTSNGSGQATLSSINLTASTTFVQTLSKTGGSFRIDHPLPDLNKTHDLVHSFVESPDANNIYRGVVTLTNGQATVNLDEVSRMTEGTFVALNREVQAFVSNQSDWDAVKASVNGSTLTIQCQNTQSTASISWLVIGMRKDKYMFDTDWTDDNGYVITEPLTTRQQELTA